MKMERGAIMNKKLTLQELELLNTASAYNGAQHGEICGKAALELIEYKKIEEELGIDLLTLFKALKDGVYYLNTQKEIHWCQARNLVISQKALRVYRHHYKLFKDYGKTWALTKEELL